MRRVNRRDQGERAFTLVEALLAAVVLAMAITAVTLPFTAGARNQRVELHQTLAVSLAEELMEEILLRSFEEPGDGDTDPEPEDNFGPEGDETTRADFDAIDDYDGYEEAPGSLTHSDGSAVTDEGAVWMSRHVTVQYMDVQVAGETPPEDPCFLQVTVEVRDRGEAMVKLVRLVHWLQWREWEDDD